MLTALARIAWGLCVATVPAAACSVAMCNFKGIEVRPSFRISVKHEKQPLPKVRVKILRYAGSEGVEVFSGFTGVDGTVRVTDLRAGDYSLEAERLGIHAGSDCFHVSATPAILARREFKYEWGYAPDTFRAAEGRITFTGPSADGTPLQNVLHPGTVAIKDARLKLQSPRSEKAFHAVSKEDGTFSFGSIPNGLYVLHVEGGAGGPYDPTDSLIELSTTEPEGGLNLSYQEAGGGSCSRTILNLKQ